MTAIEVKMTIEIKPFNRSSEIPKILGISPATLYRRIHEGTLPPMVKLGGYGSAKGYDYETITLILKGIPHDRAKV